MKQMKHANRSIQALLILAASSRLGLAGSFAARDVAGETNAPSPIRLTLSEAVTEALHLNPTLKAASHQAAAARREASGAARSRFGALQALGNYSYLNDDQLIRPMSSELATRGFAGMPFDRSQAHYGLSYEIPLYVGGRLESQIQIAKLEARKAADLLEGTRWQVRFNVTSLYANLWALEQTETALDEQIAALAQTKSNLNEMVSLGKRPELDRLKVIEDLEAAQSDRAAAGANQRRLAALLLSVLGRDPAGQIIEAPLAEPPPLSGLDEAKLAAEAANNSAVRAASVAVQQGARGVELARGEFLPSVYAGANVMENSGTTIGRNEETWGATVSVNLPLFEWGSRFSKLKAAREKQAAADEALRQVQLQTQAAFQEALAKFSAAQTNITAARARVAAGAEAARIEQVRYDTGAGTVEDLLRARSREEAARAAVASAQADLVISAERINSIIEKEVLP